MSKGILCDYYYLTIGILTFGFMFVTLAVTKTNIYFQWEHLFGQITDQYNFNHFSMILLHQIRNNIQYTIYVNKGHDDGICFSNADIVHLRHHFFFFFNSQKQNLNQ